MSYRNPLSRRSLLRGLGLTLGLPWLESARAVLASAGESGALSGNLAASGATPPRRFAAIFVPNGVHMEDWRPATEGYGYELPYILEPLARVQDDLLVLSGLTHDKGRANGDGAGDHARSASVFLTGAQPRKTDGANIRSGVSVDQVAARSLSGITRFASIELGCEAGRSAGNCDSGYSCAYSSNISWSGPSSPQAKEVNPRLVFERLFTTGNAEASRNLVERNALRKSVLDYLQDDARRLHKQLAKGDQRKLDEYLNGVREIERRIELSESQTLKSDLVDYASPRGIPEDYGDHLRLMCDMVVLAFQTDSTRVATLMFADAGSNRSYRLIDVPDGHHDLSHHGGDPVKHSKIRKINNFHVAQYAYLLQKLKSIPEGEGTLLDNCMVLYGSGLCDGNRHNHDDLPVLLAGRGGGSIDTGRHVRVPGETPMCNLFLSVLDRMGTPTEFIGDSTDRLTGLTV